MSPPSLAAAAAAFFLASALFSHTVAARLILLAFGAVCCAVALARDWRSLWPLPPIWLPFLLWAAWCAASLFWSQEPERSIKEFRNEVLYSALALWVCYVGAQARNAARLMLPIAGAGAFLVCGVALYHSRDLAGYQTGWHGGPGNFSSTLITLLPCALLAALYGKQSASRLMPWAIALAIVVFVASGTTLNRTIWIAFAVQVLLACALLVRRNGLPAGARARRIGMVLLIGLLAAASVMTFRTQSEREALEPSSVTQDPRLKLWPEVLDHIKQRPLVGYGFGRGIARHALHEEFKNPLLWHAHNLFLDIALQTGIVGLALFLLLLAMMLREGWRMVRSADDLVAACGVALIVMIVGMAVRNFTDTLLVRQNALLFWGVAGVLLGWGRTAPSRA
jgi:O-antigen ligase